jgi:tetratricopeptide (TPR) repeat protein
MRPGGVKKVGYLLGALMAALGVLPVGQDLSAVALVLTPQDGEITPQDIAALDSLLAANLFAEVTTAAHRLLDRKPGPSFFTWQVLERLGLAHHGLGQWDDAVSVLEQAVRLAPEAPTPHLNLAATLMALGKRGRAFAEYQQAVRLDPENWRARLGFGQTLLAYKMFSQAKEQLLLAQELCDGCLESTQALAQLFLAEEDFLAATGYLSILYEAEGTPKIRALLANAYFQSGDREAARRLCLPHWPENLSPAERRIVMGADLATGDVTRAQFLAENLPDLKPDLLTDPVLWGLVSLICLEGNLWEQGLRAVDLAISLDPQNVTYLNNRVFLLTRLGRHQEAEQEWRRVLELDPSLQKPNPTAP